MQNIKANIVDALQEKIYTASIEFDTHIRSISKINCDANLPYILPGLVDAHVHIESSMLSPSEFARLVVHHGTLAVVADPHEIANVLGIDGINYMLEDASHVPFRFVFGAPSCVPATPFESAGAVINADDIENLFRDGKASYLSEMMNFPGVVNQDPTVMAKIAIAKKYGKSIDGHAPGLTGEALNKYVKAGISTDHECSTIAEAEEKIKLGMKILIRNGSAAKNFAQLYPLIKQYPNQVMLCTDDMHPDNLLHGHINQLLAEGIRNGLDIFSLLQVASINPVKHYQIDLGLLQVGDSADFIIADNLKEFTISQSFFQGACLFNRGGEELIKRSAQHAISPNKFNAKKISEADIEVVATSEKMKVIQVIDGALLTHQVVIKADIGDKVTANIKEDILKIIVLNRYQASKPAVAFIQGFGLKQGALGSTVAHDSHHIVVVGCDDKSIISAINQIIDMKGGLVAITDNHRTLLQLDIAGLMSSASGEEVAQKYEALNKQASVMGSVLTAPFMTLAFMSLLVIPDLKIGDKGLFDVKRFQYTNLFK